MLVSALFLLLGAVWSSFNLLAMLRQRRPLQPVSLIICLISSANILLDATTLAILVRECEFHRTWLPLYSRVLMVVWLGTSAVSFWSVAWLSTLYCITVVRSSSPLLLAFKRHVEVVVRTGLALTLVSSYLMFLPLLGLQSRQDPCSTHASHNPITLNATNASQNLLQTFTDSEPHENITCVSWVIVFPVRVNLEVYVVSFTCYLLLLPLCAMLPTSLRLVVYLCNHALSVRANHSGFSGPDSYLLVCGVTVALVAIFVTTLFTISLYYLHSTFHSQLSGEVLFYTLSYYCLASAMLLSASNRQLRERLRMLFCRPHTVQETTAP